MKRFAIPLCACLALAGLGLLAMNTERDATPAAATDGHARPELRAQHSRPAAGGEAGVIESRGVDEASRPELPAPLRVRSDAEREAEAEAGERRQAQIDRNLARLERAVAKAEAAGQLEQAQRLRERAALLEEMGRAG